MKRTNPYKIFLVLVVMAAGVVCMLLPREKVLPVDSVSDVAKQHDAIGITDTIGVKKGNNNLK